VVRLRIKVAVTIPLCDILIPPAAGGDRQDKVPADQQCPSDRLGLRQVLQLRSGSALGFKEADHICTDGGKLRLAALGIGGVRLTSDIQKFGRLANNSPVTSFPDIADNEIDS
jgi:hypothetical protein